MNQALNLIQDLEFTEATESAETVVGGLSIAHRPVHDGRWKDWFTKPVHPIRPVHPVQPVHPIRPVHPPIFELPQHPRPFPLPHPLPVFETH
jgi:hypothetical protein